MVLAAAAFDRAAASNDDLILPHGTGASVSFHGNAIKLGSRFAAYDTFCKTYQACHDVTRDDRVIALTRENWEKIVTVHARVHAALRTVEDFKKYPLDPKSKKAPDIWTYGEDGTGDCEDYANRWQKELIAQGLPPSAVLRMILSSDEVERGTVNGRSVTFSQAHMVVLIRTNQGDFVADMGRQRLLPLAEIEKKWKIDLVESPRNQTDFVGGAINRPSPQIAAAPGTPGPSLQ